MCPTARRGLGRFWRDCSVLLCEELHPMARIVCAHRVRGDGGWLVLASLKLSPVCDTTITEICQVLLILPCLARTPKCGEPAGCLCVTWRELRMAMSAARMPPTLSVSVRFRVIHLPCAVRMLRTKYAELWSQTRVLLFECACLCVQMRLMQLPLYTNGRVCLVSPAPCRS